MESHAGPRMQPEMSRDVQKYDKQVYLRVSEAQRCRVNTTVVVPIFSPETVAQKPVAVFELVQSVTACAFPLVMSWLQRSLKVRADARAMHPSRMHASQSLMSPMLPGLASGGAPGNMRHANSDVRHARVAAQGDRCRQERAAVCAPDSAG